MKKTIRNQKLYTLQQSPCNEESHQRSNHSNSHMQQQSLSNSLVNFMVFKSYDSLEYEQLSNTSFYNSLQQWNDTPGPSDYSPKLNYILRKSPNQSFSKAIRKPSNYESETFNRYPGPGHYNDVDMSQIKKRKIGYKFQPEIKKQQSLNSSYQGNQLGPGQYDIQKQILVPKSCTKGVSFSKTPKSQLFQSDNTQQIIGPGTYDLQNKNNHKVQVPIMSPHNQKDLIRYKKWKYTMNVPGVGEYDLNIKIQGQKKGKIAFSKEPRFQYNKVLKYNNYPGPDYYQLPTSFKNFADIQNPSPTEYLKQTKRNFIAKQKMYKRLVVNQLSLSSIIQQQVTNSKKN